MKIGVIGILMAILTINISNAQIRQNQWSAEVNMGINNAVRPFTNGYGSSNSGGVGGINLNHYDLGIKYMFSTKVGFKWSLGYDSVKSSVGSIPFETQFYRMGVEAVFNFGEICDFKDFTNRFGFLVHLGPQVGVINPANIKSELNRGLMIGFTPQFKLTDHFALNADLTILQNRSQNYTWNGSPAGISNNLDGLMYNSSIGITYFFAKGKEKKQD